MAIYEYLCQECQHLFSVTETISRHGKHRKPPPCPQCGGSETRRIFSTFFAKTSSKS
ncbi:MAG: FmdB family zinc ribbon protein [Gemmatimonadota bacterium]